MKNVRQKLNRGVKKVQGEREKSRIISWSSVSQQKVSVLTCALVIKHHIEVEEDFVLLRTVSFLFLKLVVVAAANKVSFDVELRNFKGVLRQRLDDIYRMYFQSIWNYLGCPATGSARDTIVSWWLSPEP